MIRIEANRGVGTVTLARPDSRNALTPEMLESLKAAIDDLGPRVGAVVVAGEGSVFCAGFDLMLCRESRDGSVMRALLTGLDAAVRAMRACPVPVVVACHGAAIAGGCALVAGSDFAVADRNAKLGYPVVLLGVSPAVSAPTLVPRVGSGAARVRMLDPGLISGEQAAKTGLVSDLVEERAAVHPAANRLAECLAAKGRGAIVATKRWLSELDGTAPSEPARVGPGGPAPSLARGALSQAPPRAQGARSSGSPDGLAVSLGLAGGEEERILLERFWASRNR